MYWLPVHTPSKVVQYVGPLYTPASSSGHPEKLLELELDFEVLEDDSLELLELLELKDELELLDELLELDELELDVELLELDDEENISKTCIPLPTITG